MDNLETKSETVLEMFKRKKDKITVEDVGVDANGWLNAPLMNRSLNGRWTFLIDIASRNGKSNYIEKKLKMIMKKEKRMDLS